MEALFIRKVIYDPAEEQEFLRERLCDMTEAFEGIVPAHDRAEGMALLPTLMAEHALRYMSAKHAAFQAECEWRHSQGETDAHPRVRERGGALAPYVEVPLWGPQQSPPVCIVRLGPLQDEVRGAFAVRTLWKSTGNGAFPLTVEPSSVPYQQLGKRL